MIKIKQFFYGTVILLIGFFMTCCLSCSTEEEAKEPKEQTISVELKVPDTTWGIQIQDVYQVKDELWVISKLEQLPGNVLGAMIITTVSDKVTVPAHSETVKYFVLGKTWQWENEEPYTFLKGIEEIQDDLKSATRLELKRG